MLDERPRSRPCAGMKGIIEEGGEFLKMDKRETNENLNDAAIISAAQKVEHYEIAAYGTLRTFAEMLGNDRIAQLLEQTKQEEAEADRKLSSISENLLSAEREGGEEAGEDEGMGRSRSAGNGRSPRRPASNGGRGRRSR